MTPDWDALAKKHPQGLVNRLREYEAGNISITAAELAQAASSLDETFDEDTALALLHAAGPITRHYWDALANEHPPRLVNRLHEEYAGGSILITAAELAQAASSVEQTFDEDTALALLQAAGPITRDYWDALAKEHPQRLVKRLHKEYTGGSISFTGAELAHAASSLDETFDEDTALTLLQAAGTWLGKESRDGDVDPEFPNEPPKSIESFTWEGSRGRSLGWLLLIHGMNTSGAWQQKFAFDLGTWRGTAVPTYVYKYGWVVLGVVLPWRRSKLKKKLRERILELATKAGDQRLPNRPDVIAHSFGTWLLGQVLLDEMRDGKPDKIKLGRVILTGSVLPPDFPWLELQQKKLVGDVLNHYAANDPVVPWAHWTIWKSGPSGRRGFDRPASSHQNLSVLNVKAAPEGHSGVFSRHRRFGSYSEVWRPFLTNPDGQASRGFQTKNPCKTWRQAWWPLRGTLLSLIAIPLLATLLIWGFLELGPGITGLRDNLAGFLGRASGYMALAAGSLLGLYFLQMIWWWLADRKDKGTASRD